MASTTFQVRAAVDYRLNQSDVVFFRVNLKEMFGVDINYRGMRKCLNTAFMSCKQYVPFDTGITYRSFTQKQLTDYEIEYFFDPKKVIGQTRKGVVVKDYYVKYIASTPKNYSWLTKVMYDFYETLFREVSHLPKAKKQIAKGERMYVYDEQILDDKGAKIFVRTLREEYRLKREEAKRIKQQTNDLRKKLLHNGGNNNGQQ